MAWGEVYALLDLEDFVSGHARQLRRPSPRNHLRRN